MAGTVPIEAVVEFEYTAKEPDELTIKKGDVIKNIRTQSGGWWEGTLGEKRGMFPDNFVKVLTGPNAMKDSSTGILRPKSGRRCRVAYSYTPNNADELELKVNDIIEVLEEVEEGWWRGKLRDMVGVFPSNFVEEVIEPPSSAERKPKLNSKEETREGNVEKNVPPAVAPNTDVQPPESKKNTEDSDVPARPPKPVKEMCVARYPYNAQNEDELSLNEGDVITIISRDVADQGWWKGELRGRSGLFPDNFVELILTEDQFLKPDRPPAKPQSVVTTNRVRDSIIKQPQKDISEDSTIQAQSSSAVKPQVPQKPRSTDLTDGILHSKGSMTPSHELDEVSPSNEFDMVERSDMLIHPTASRAKAPGRRPPSMVGNRDIKTSSNNNLMNGDASHETEEKEISPQSGRVWERRKAPWMEELKLSQARKSVGETKPVPIKSKPDPGLMSSEKINSAERVVLRHNTSSRIVTGESVRTSSSSTRPVSMNAALLHTDFSKVTLTSTNKTVTHADLSRIGNTKSTSTSPINNPKSLLSTSPTASAKIASLPGAPGMKYVSPTADVDHVSNKQYLELREKVVELEKALQEQGVQFSQTLKDLTEKLNEEVNRRMRIEQELDKLSKIVTQV